MHIRERRFRGCSVAKPISRYGNFSGALYILRCSRSPPSEQNYNERFSRAGSVPPLSWLRVSAAGFTSVCLLFLTGKSSASYGVQRVPLEHVLFCKEDDSIVDKTPSLVASSFNAIGRRMTPSWGDADILWTVQSKWSVANLVCKKQKKKHIARGVRIQKYTD